MTEESRRSCIELLPASGLFPVMREGHEVGDNV